MKNWVPAIGLAALLCGAAFDGPGRQTVIFLTGDFRGQLSPCGCTKPMDGGIRRLATAVRQLGTTEKPILLMNTALIDGAGRQDELKLEAIAEASRAMDATLVVAGASETRLGSAMVDSANQLSGGNMKLSTPMPEPTVEGDFAIIPATPSDASEVRRASGEAAQSGRRLIVVLDGDRREAQALARDVPAVALIQYRSVGTPPTSIEWVEGTALATPGEYGKALVRLLFDGRTFSDYRVVPLTAGFKDDPDVARIYARYLRRVDREGLLGKVARLSSAAFAGSQACAPCHGKLVAQWKASKHAGAYATLEKEGHATDPDCVPCHVVGLDRQGGFASRSSTPRLANVGCESCHGPAKLHALAPRKSRLQRVQPSTCVNCHTTLTSPGFDFKTFWAKIRH